MYKSFVSTDSGLAVVITDKGNQTDTDLQNQGQDLDFAEAPPSLSPTASASTSTSTSDDNDNGNNIQTSNNNFPVCRALKSHTNQHQSAAALWTQNFDKILQASRHPQDVHYDRHNHTKSLLLDLVPARLRSALKSRPKPQDVERILEIVEKRRADPDQNRPLMVLVMGGSVAEGRGCQEDLDDVNNKSDSDNTNTIKGRDCAWPFRLNSFINNLLGFDGIKIVNMASGGTNSNQGTGLVKYWMYPQELLPHGPDIIINAYGANDSNFVPSASHIRNSNPREAEMEQYQGVVRQTQTALNSFVDTIYHSHGCPPPLVFHLDEYVGGHAKGGIFQDLAYTSTLTQMAQWYGNLAVSSADVVRRIIYADTSETVFSPVWRMRQGKFREECHFGAAGHELIMWAFGYSLLEVMTSFCEDQDLHEHLHGIIGGTFSKEPKISPAALELVNNNNVPPPPLDLALRLEDVSTRWASRAEERKEYCSGPVGGLPCLFAWVAGPEGQTKNPGSLNSYLKPYITSSDGSWTSEADMSHGWSRKLGFVPTKAGATVDFVMENVTDEIHVININYIKSYGEKWAGSLARVTVSVKESGSEEFTEAKHYDLEGIHDSNTSVSYSSSENLDDHFVKVGSTLKVNLTMIGGSAFKITGMMFCRF